MPSSPSMKIPPSFSLLPGIYLIISSLARSLALSSPLSLLPADRVALLLSRLFQSCFSFLLPELVVLNEVVSLLLFLVW